MGREKEVKEGKRKIGKRKGEVGKQKENVWGMKGEKLMEGWQISKERGI